MKLYKARFLKRNPTDNKLTAMGSITLNDDGVGPQLSLFAKAFRHAGAAFTGATRVELTQISVQEANQSVPDKSVEKP